MTGVINTDPKLDDLTRIRFIRDKVEDLVKEVDLVVVEGLAYKSVTGHSMTRAGMWWLVLDRVDDSGVKWIVCEPNKLKKFATGVGNATKDKVMLATARQFKDFDGDNNQADALWLASYGLMCEGKEQLVSTTALRLDVIGR